MKSTYSSEYSMCEQLSLCYILRNRQKSGSLGNSASRQQRASLLADKPSLCPDIKNTWIQPYQSDHTSWYWRITQHKLRLKRLASILVMRVTDTSTDSHRPWRFDSSSVSPTWSRASSWYGSLLGWLIDWSIDFWAETVEIGLVYVKPNITNCIVRMCCDSMLDQHRQFASLQLKRRRDRNDAGTRMSRDLLF
jgi:hypothetical protein